MPSVMPSATPSPFRAKRELFAPMPTLKTSTSELGNLLKDGYFNSSVAIIHIITNDLRVIFTKYIEDFVKAFKENPMAAKYTIVENSWMFYRLCVRGCIRYNVDELWRIIYAMKDRYILHSSKLTMYALYDMQDCFHYFNSTVPNGTLKIKKFLTTMTRLRERRLRIAKKRIYYYAIKNVICNPSHPVGKRLILKEYESVYTMDLRYG